MSSACLEIISDSQRIAQSIKLIATAHIARVLRSAHKVSSNRCSNPCHAPLWEQNDKNREDLLTFVEFVVNRECKTEVRKLPVRVLLSRRWDGVIPSRSPQESVRLRRWIDVHAGSAPCS